MPDFITYPELSCLASDTVLVCNNYHGTYHATDVRYRAIIYTCFGEVLNFLEIDRVLKSFPESFIIIVTARRYPEIPRPSDRYHLITMPTAYAWYATKMSRSPLVLDSRKFTKRFLSLNNRAQWNRQALTQLLVNFDLLNQWYFSYWCEDRYQLGRRNIYDHVNEIIGCTWFNKDLDLDSLFDLIPITTGLDEFEKVGNDWTIGNPSYYDQSFCSVINETYIDENNDPFFTEKIMKPLAYGHPFLLHSSSGALRSLKESGFITFPDFFDESYDDIDSPQLRCEHIFKEILRLSQLSDKEINNMYRAMIPRLQHNHDFFWNEWPRQYQQDIIEVKEKISDILTKIL